MKKITDTLTNAAVKTRFAGMRTKEKIASVLRRDSGEGFVDTALKILISVVIGALLLAGLYVLFSDTVLPTLTDRVKELFDYNG